MMIAHRHTMWRIAIGHMRVDGIPIRGSVIAGLRYSMATQRVPGGPGFVWICECHNSTSSSRPAWFAGVSPAIIFYFFQELTSNYQKGQTQGSAPTIQYQIHQINPLVAACAPHCHCHWIRAAAYGCFGRPSSPPRSTLPLSLPLKKNSQLRLYKQGFFCQNAFGGCQWQRKGHLYAR